MRKRRQTSRLGRLYAYWRRSATRGDAPTDEELAQLVLKFINAPDIPYPLPHEEPDYGYRGVFMKGPNGPFVTAREAQERLDRMTAEFETAYIVHPELSPRRWHAPNGDAMIEAKAVRKYSRAWDLPLSKFEIIAAEFFERVHRYAEQRDGDFLFWRQRPTYVREEIEARGSFAPDAFVAGRQTLGDAHMIIGRLCISRNATRIKGAYVQEAA